MPCKEIQALVVSRAALNPSERMHLDSCAECRAFALDDLQLSHRLEGWRDPGTLPARRRTPVRSFRFAYVGVGALAALTFAFLALPTGSNAQTAYRRMLEQVRDVRSLHLVVRWRSDTESQPMRKSYELWWRPGAWREESPGRRPTLKLQDSRGLWFFRYDPADGKVRALEELAPQTDFGTFDLAAFAEEYMAKPERFEQPSANQIVALGAGGRSRLRFDLDPATRLPIHAEKQNLLDGTWQTDGEIDLQFDVAIPESKFSRESLIPVPEP